MKRNWFTAGVVSGLWLTYIFRKEQQGRIYFRQVEKAFFRAEGHAGRRPVLLSTRQYTQAKEAFDAAEAAYVEGTIDVWHVQEVVATVRQLEAIID